MENGVVEDCKVDCCDSKMEEGTSNESCCDQRVVNSGEPHVSFHDGSLYTVPTYKNDYLGNDLSVPVRTAFQGAYTNTSPTTLTPKMMSSVSQAYPSTYTIGGQNISYFSATPSVTPTFASAAPTYYAGTATGYSAPTVSRSAQQLSTYSSKPLTTQTPYEAQYVSTTYGAPQTYTAGQTASYSAPQTYTAAQTTSYSAPQTYTAQTSSYTMPQSYSAAYTMPSSAVNYNVPYQVPTVIEESGNTSYPFNYPTVADYPTNVHSYNPNASPFTQDELATFYQNYLGKGHESMLEVARAPSHRCHSLKNEPTMMVSSPQSTKLTSAKKLPPAKFPLRKKKGCCGC